MAVQRRPDTKRVTRELTPRQAAELLGVCPSTLRNLTDAGVLAYRRTAGGHRRFSEADVLALRSWQASGEPPDAAARAAVWQAAILELLSAAEADLGTSPLSEPIRAAAAALRTSRARPA